MSYPIPRTEYLSAMFEAGLQAGAAAIMPWELVAWHVRPNASSGFDFGVDDSSFGPVTQMVEQLYHRVRNASHCLLDSAKSMNGLKALCLSWQARLQDCGRMSKSIHTAEAMQCLGRLRTVHQARRHRAARARLCMR